MKSDVEKLNPTRVKLSVEVTADELAPYVDNAYKMLANQLNVPGFRRGKVPPPIIDQRVGRGAVLQEAINEGLPQMYGQAAAEAEIIPVGRPEVEITEVPDPKAGGDLKFDVEVDVRPDIEIPDFSDLEVEVDNLDVTEDDVQTRLDDLRARFGTLVGVDRVAKSDDFTSIDLTAKVGGEEIDSASGLSYQIGSGTMLDGLDEALIGLSADEETTFATTLVGGEHADKEAEVTVKLNSVKERELPEVDDEFAQLASEFDTLDELMADLRTQTEKMKKYELGMQARNKLLDKLGETLDIPVPESMIDAEVEAHLSAEGKEADDEHSAEVREQAVPALRNQMLLDAIVAEEDLQVNQAELIEYLVMTAPQYGMDPQAFATAVEQADQIPQMVGEVARRKALASILEKVTIKDADGNTVDVDDLVEKPASDSDDAASDISEG